MTTTARTRPDSGIVAGVIVGLVFSCLVVAGILLVGGYGAPSARRCAVACACGEAGQ